MQHRGVLIGIATVIGLGWTSAFAAAHCEVNVDGYKLEFSAQYSPTDGVVSKVRVDGESADLLAIGCQTVTRPGTQHMRCPHEIRDLRIDVYPDLNPETRAVEAVAAVFSSPFDTFTIQPEDCE